MTVTTRSLVLLVRIGPVLAAPIIQVQPVGFTSANTATTEANLAEGRLE